MKVVVAGATGAIGRRLVPVLESAGHEVAQGLAYAYEPSGAGLADEDTPLCGRPPRQFAPVVAALRELEARTTGAGGLVLRLGHLYGLGTMFAGNGSFTADVRAGARPPIKGKPGLAEIK